MYYWLFLSVHDVLSILGCWHDKLNMRDKLNMHYKLNMHDKLNKHGASYMFGQADLMTQSRKHVWSWCLSFCLTNWALWCAYLYTAHIYSASPLCFFPWFAHQFVYTAGDHLVQPASGARRWSAWRVSFETWLAKLLCPAIQQRPSSWGMTQTI